MGVQGLLLGMMGACAFQNMVYLIIIFCYEHICFPIVPTIESSEDDVDVTLGDIGDDIEMQDTINSTPEI